MAVFTDSSALVKLYADEDDHEMVRSLGVIAVSQLARVEVPAALWRKQRLGELGMEETQILTAEFEADYYGTSNETPKFAVIAISNEILDRAARMCATHALRAFDGIQLACAVAARDADRECTDFAVFDGDLRRAGAAEGLTIVPGRSR